MTALGATPDAAPDRQLALIGCGNMGCALLGGLIRAGWRREQLIGADPDAARREALQARLGVRATPDNIDACRDAGILVLAVKPQQLRQVARALAPCLKARGGDGPLIVSLAAGIPLRALEQWLGPGLAIVRTMPNTPCLLGKGASGLLGNRQVQAPGRQLAETLMRSVGLALWFDSDAELDAVCATSGCGPAYFFLIMEAMEQAAVEMGLSGDKARALILATAEGAALLARERDAPPGALRREVSSPGGSTEQALAVLQEGQLQALVIRALRAAQARSAEMAREAEHRESGPRETEHREAERRGAERREAERREAGPRETVPRETEPRETEHREAERRGAERREAGRRKAGRRKTEPRETGQ